MCLHEGEASTIICVEHAMKKMTTIGLPLHFHPHWMCTVCLIFLHFGVGLRKNFDCMNDESVNL